MRKVIQKICINEIYLRSEISERKKNARYALLIIEIGWGHTQYGLNSKGALNKMQISYLDRLKIK